MSTRRGELTTTVALLMLAALAWALTIYQSRTMACGMCTGMSVACPMCMGTGKPLFISLTVFLTMWTTMMAAMMLPSIIPMVLLFARVAEQRRARKASYVPTWIFVGGYLAAWALIGLVAFVVTRLVQWGLSVVPEIARYNQPIAGLTLVVAGLYQLSPFKHRCLHYCRSPLDFILGGWREGYWGALRMGTSHGLYCAGCCLGLMVVLFAVGLMNLAWMAGLTGVMSVEKLSERGAFVGRVAGVLLLAVGAVLVIGPSALRSLI